MVCKNIMECLLQDSGTVFRINDIAMLTGEEKDSRLSKKLYYYVKTGRLLNPRNGIYAKPAYNPEELACLLYTPTYISLEYVLQRAGIIFQFDTGITNISYLSRELSIDNQIYRYRQVKGEILTNTAGINRNKSNINIASPERAALDMLYLNKDYYFDNINPLDKKIIKKLLPIYSNNSLYKNAKSRFEI